MTTADFLPSARFPSNVVRPSWTASKREVGILAVGVALLVPLGTSLPVLATAAPAAPVNGASAGAGTSPAAPAAPGPSPSSLRTALPLHPSANAPSPSFPLNAKAPVKVVGPAWNSPGRPPAAWTDGTPPGAAALRHNLAPSSGSSSSGSQFPAGCYGVWPSSDWNIGGQGSYQSSCYGHDEPGIQFYSNLPGSGGNVTWNVTLPVDKSPTQNQSDLYTAIWFGMTLQDPRAWMDQCFLELQFYPDQSYYNPGPIPTETVNGQWIGYAVAWEINLTNGYEDPCFGEPLYLNGVPGPAFLNMSQGDNIVVTMSGYPTSTVGEQIQVQDRSNGQSSTLTMSSPYFGPLNPAYVANNWEAGLQWTPGGEYPVVFAFENGHTWNYSVNNNEYGGCNSGPPPAPNTPCGSYDPGSWANDTAAPWQIRTPTFFNGTTTQTPVQVAFTQDFGGISMVDELSSACAGLEGSAWCSYPWYSYSCDQKAFEFGATDWATTSQDFGKYLEYATAPQFVTEALGYIFSYDPPTNFTVPTCGATSYSVTAGTGYSATGESGGSLHFLNEVVTGSASFGDLLPGNYSISAMSNNSSLGFDGWQTTGAVSVTTSTSNWTTLYVQGVGTVTAEFGPIATANRGAVTFVDAGAPESHIAIDPGRLYGLASLATVPSGATVVLSTGVYQIQAEPAPGFEFSDWTVSGSGRLSTLYFPAPLLVVEGNGAVTVTAHYAASDLLANLLLVAIGPGTVSFENGTTSASGFPASQGTATVLTGTYAVDATPGPGGVFLFYEYLNNIVMIDPNATSNVTIEPGVLSELLAVFAAVPTVQTDSPPNAEVQVFDGSGAALGPAATSAVAPALPGVPFFVAAYTSVPNLVFTNWYDSAPGELWVLSSPDLPAAMVLLNATSPSAAAAGILQANFTTSSATILNVNFTVSPANSGFLVINNVATEGPLAGFGAAAGASYVAYGVGNGVNLSGSIATTSSVVVTPLPPFLVLTMNAPGPDNITGSFAPPPVGVTFVAVSGQGAHAVINGTAVASGSTTMLALGGSYSLDLSLAANSAFVNWTATGDLVVTDPLASTTTVTVDGPGTIYATLLTVTPPVAYVASSFYGNLPGSLEADVGYVLTSTAFGPSPVGYSWGSLPTGCASGHSGTLACASPAGTYTATVTATFGSTSVSASSTIVVGANVTVASFSASPSQLTVGPGSTVLTVGAAGGVAPYTYEYFGLPAGCSSADVASLICVPTQAGTYHVTVTVSDAYGARTTRALTLVVNPTPTVRLGLPATDSGHPVNLSVTVTGGTAPYALVWSDLPSGCAASAPTTASSAGTVNFTCTPSAAGSFAVAVTLSDASGATASNVTGFGVSPALSVVVIASTPVHEGANAAIAALVSGGSGSYAFAWSGLPSGCAGSGSSIGCAPNATGTYTVKVTVTDGVGAAASASAQMVVKAASSPSSSSSGISLSSTEGLGILIGAVLVTAVVLGVVGYLAGRRGGGGRAPPTEYVAPSDTGPIESPPPEGGSPPGSG